MELNLRGKRALVTGASRGIGAAVAAELAGEGMDVCLVARDSACLETAAEALRSSVTGKIAVCAADLTAPAACIDAVAAAVGAFGGLDLLVNNAGAARGGNILKLDDTDWRDGFALKFDGYARMSRAAWPHLKASGGSIINIVGISALTPRPALAIGGAVNSALLNLSKAYAEQGRRDGVRVNSISPGHILTDRLRERIKALAEERSISMAEAEAEMRTKLGIDRFGRPEEIGWLAAFLASGRAAYIQGAALTIDGGVTAGL